MIALLLAACTDPSDDGDGKRPPRDGDTDTVPACVGAGFEAAPAAWALPSGYPADTFGQAVDGSGGDPAWALVDLDGDGTSELVVTEDAAADRAIGTSKWLVYENDGDGFSGTPTEWELPSGYESGTFALSSGGSSSSLVWALVDLDGDGPPDLVFTTDDAADPAIGTGKWLVYPNDGGGFAGTPVEWALPAGYPQGTFEALGDTRSQSPTWGLADLAGDGRADLVITYDPDADAAIGAGHWAVYTNIGDGFAATSTRWGLPAGYPGSTFQTLADASSSDPAWALLDLDGDAAAELVITEDGADDAIGQGRWAFYPNEGDRFGATLEAWALPGGYPAGTFTRFYDASSGSPNWTLLDLDRDDVPDVVFTEDSGADAAIGTSTWLVWRGTASGVEGSPASWDLPGGYAARQFAQPYDSSGSSPNWALLTLDDVHAYDIVFTKDSAVSEAIGTSEWQVYRGVCE